MYVYIYIIVYIYIYIIYIYICNNLAKDARKNNRIVCKLCSGSHTHSATTNREGLKGSEKWFQVSRLVVVMCDRKSSLFVCDVCTSLFRCKHEIHQKERITWTARHEPDSLYGGAFLELTHFLWAPYSYGSYRSYGLSWLELHVADLCPAVSKTSMISWLPVHMSIQV